MRKLKIIPFLFIFIAHATYSQVDQGSRDGGPSGEEFTKKEKEQVKRLNLRLLDLTDDAMKRWSRCTTVTEPKVNTFYDFYTQLLLLNTKSLADECLHKNFEEKKCVPPQKKKVKAEKESVFHCLVSSKNRKTFLKDTYDPVYSSALTEQGVPLEKIDELTVFLREKFKD